MDIATVLVSITLSAAVAAITGILSTYAVLRYAEAEAHRAAAEEVAATFRHSRRGGGRR